jgi:hypothetical protein
MSEYSPLAAYGIHAYFTLHETLASREPRPSPSNISVEKARVSQETFIVANLGQRTMKNNNNEKRAKRIIHRKREADDHRMQNDAKFEHRYANELRKELGLVHFDTSILFATLSSLCVAVPARFLPPVTGTALVFGRVRV